jgi:hypothetical protein
MGAGRETGAALRHCTEQSFLGFDTQNKQVGLNFKNLCIKGHNQQSKKAIHGIADNICNYVSGKS